LNTCAYIEDINVYLRTFCIDGMKQESVTLGFEIILLNLLKGWWN